MSEEDVSTNCCSPLLKFVAILTNTQSKATHGATSIRQQQKKKKKQKTQSNNRINSWVLKLFNHQWFCVFQHTFLGRLVTHSYAYTFPTAHVYNSVSRQTCAWPGTWKSWQKFSATRWNSDEVDVTTICFQRERVYCILYYAPRLSSVCTVARSVPHNTECSAIFVAHRRPNTLFIVYMKCLLLFANHVLCIWLQFLKHHTLKMKKKKKRVKNKQQCIKKNE